MAHLAGQQFIGLFGLLAAGHVEKNTNHDTANNARVIALATSRNPPDVVLDHDAKVYLVGPEDSARRSKRCPNPVAIGWVDVGG